MFNNIFGDFFNSDPNISLIDRQQAEEATSKSGLDKQELQKQFYDTFLKARAERNRRNALKI